MNYTAQHRRGRLTLAQALILTLAFVLFALGARNAYPAESRGILWAKPALGATWRTDLVVTGHATLPTLFEHGCVMAPRPKVDIPAHGAAFVSDFGAVQCPNGAPWGVLDVPVAKAPGELVTRAENVASGQTLYVPAATFEFTAPSETARAGGLRNIGTDATFVLAFNEGAAGIALATIYDGNGERIGHQALDLAEGLTFAQILVPFEAGSIVLRMGYEEGRYGPGGPVTAWATSGPFSNSSAARVVPFAPELAEVEP